MRCLGLLLLGACATSANGDQASGGGKADGTGDPACSQHYIEWVLGTYKPALEAQPLDDARVAALTELAKDAPCRGELLEPTAWTTWNDVITYEVTGPYMKRHGAALVTLVRGGGYDGYVTDSMPLASDALAIQALVAARPMAALERVDADTWFGPYRTLAEEVLTPLTFETAGRELEGPWSLNAGETAMLDLVEQTRPKSTRDGGYGSWMDEYGDILANGVNATDSSDDYVAADPTLGCYQNETAPCSRDRFLDRFAALAPPSHGDDDSASWMTQLELWATLAASSTYENDAHQLARIDAARPAHLSGLAAYKSWLAAVADTATSPVYTSSVLPAKPCASGADDAYAAFASEHASLPADVLEAAKPTACN